MKDLCTMRVAKAKMVYFNPLMVGPSPKDSILNSKGLAHFRIFNSALFYYKLYHLILICFQFSILNFHFISFMSFNFYWFPI